MAEGNNNGRSRADLARRIEAYIQARRDRILPVYRRTLLKGGLAALAGGLTGISSLWPASEADAQEAPSFIHGVASGDPKSDRVIIWSRLSGVTTDSPVLYVMATDPGLSNPVDFGLVEASAANDFTVKVDCQGLTPGNDYYYGFFFKGAASPIGKTKTLPVGAVDKAKFAVFSCSNFIKGYFNVYKQAQSVGDMDALIHLGDIIYEYEPGGFGTPALSLGLVTEVREDQLSPVNETVSVADYRLRYAADREDSDFADLLAMAPIIPIWDDHEVTNDTFEAGAENHQPETEGDFFERRANAIQVYYEWLPVRVPESGDLLARPQSFDWGDLARLIVIDTRLAARDEQFLAEDTDQLIGILSNPGPDGSFPLDVTPEGEPRTLMGPEQEAFVLNEAATSTQTWQIFANQTLFFFQSSIDFINSELLTPEATTEVLAGLDAIFGPGTGETFAALGAAALPNPVAFDSWTGYPSAKARFYATLASCTNPVILTGDTHNSWAANLSIPGPDGAPTPMGVEFATPAVSSPGLEESLFIDPPLLSALFLESAPNAPFDELMYSQTNLRGFMVVDVTPERVRTEWILVDTVFSQDFTAFTDNVLEVQAGARVLNTPAS